MSFDERLKSTIFTELLGKTIVAISGAETGSGEIHFICSDNSHFLMYHDQDCCECVLVEDVCGDVDTLIGTPILLAEKFTEEGEPLDSWDESHTWTFYRLATVKGYVTIRWYGTSNGYYSESVDFAEIICKARINNEQI